MIDLPRGWAGADKYPLSATAQWMDPKTAVQNLPFKPNTLFLGAVGKTPIGVRSEQHMLTVAGSRSGKGVSAIIPNLLTYRGSVVAIDPKGELATLTAARRATGGWQNGEPFEGMGQ